MTVGLVVVCTGFGGVLGVCTVLDDVLGLGSCAVSTPGRAQSTSSKRIILFIIGPYNSTYSSQL